MPALVSANRQIFDYKRPLCKSADQPDVFEVRVVIVDENSEILRSFVLSKLERAKSDGPSLYVLLFVDQFEACFAAYEKESR